MKQGVKTYYGSALLLGALLVIITMVLHPSGGSFEHLQHIIVLTVVSHSISIMALPIYLFGFFGLTVLLRKEKLFSVLGFITISLGMIAGMIAAALNGLALPILISHYSDAAPEKLKTVKIIMNYNNSLNQAFDFIFIGCISFAMIWFCISILKTRCLPLWLGYLGLGIGLLALGGIFTGFSIVHLNGFRIFMLGFTVWSILVGVMMRKLKAQ